MTISKITIGAFLYRIGVISATQINQVNEVKLSGTRHDLIFEKELKSYEMGVFQHMFKGSFVIKVLHSIMDEFNYVTIVYENEGVEISRNDMRLDIDFNKI